MGEKPKKEVYSSDMQDKIYDTTKKVVLDIVEKHPYIYSANAFGSIVRKDLGVYDKVYDNKRHGSDVDVVCVVDPKFCAPAHWKHKGSAKAFDMYDVDAIENHMPQLGKKDLPIHPIKFLIYNPKVHDYDEAKKWTAIDKEHSESLGWQVEEWYKDTKQLKKALKR